MRKYRLVCYRKTWCIYWRDGKRPRRNSLHTRDRAEAEREYAKFLAKLKEPKQPKTVTAADCLAAYYEAKPQVIPRPAIGRFFGQMLPEAIDQDACKDYPKQRKAAIKTVHTEMGVLRAALIHAERLNWILKAPFIWMPDPGEPRDRWLTHEEAERLIAACETPHLKLFTGIALHTAGRPWAILDLTWEQVLWDRGMVNFNPPGRARTHKGRPLVKMTGELRAMLEAAHEAKNRDSAYVVSWGGQKVGSVKRAFKAACKRAGLSDVTPKTLRHTAATWMAGAGVPMRQISGILGHSSIAVTERVYAKHHPDYQKEGMAALAQFSIGQLNTPTVNRPATVSRNGKQMSAKSPK